MKTKALYNEINNEEKISSFIFSSLKHILSKYDPQATCLLFGSRARGDYHDESDWDFLVLTDVPEDDNLKDNIRRNILYEIEFKTGHHIAVIFHNKKAWQEDYRVTNLFQSIQEEGILI